MSYFSFWIYLEDFTTKGGGFNITVPSLVGFSFVFSDGSYFLSMLLVNGVSTILGTSEH